MTHLAIVLAILAEVVAPAPGANRGSAAVAARRAAIELAGAWASDGFKLRDSHWTGTLQPDKPHVVQVNLFAGNRYWFTAAAATGPGQVSVSVYDEAGTPLPSETYQDGLRAAAGFAPAASGPYLVKIEQPGGQLSTFCLVYSYK